MRNGLPDWLRQHPPPARVHAQGEISKRLPDFKKSLRALFVVLEPTRWKLRPFPAQHKRYSNVELHLPRCDHRPLRSFKGISAHDEQLTMCDPRLLQREKNSI